MVFRLPVRFSPLTLESLQPYFLAKGSERLCFRWPGDERFVLKISLFPHTKQTRREIKYFIYLQKRHIPSTHLPVFVAAVKNKTYIGLIQQKILDANGKPACSLAQRLREAPLDATGVKHLLADLLRYLYRYNILPCDLQLDNLLCQKSANDEKLILIDGLGTTNLIKIAQYIPWFGRRKIIRKMIFFLTHNTALRELFASPEEISRWVKNEIKKDPRTQRDLESSSG